MTTPERILLETDSALEHYAVVERMYEQRSARVLFSGAKRAAQSGIGLDDNPDLLFDYNQRLLEVASALYPERILVIGGGAFTLPMALVTALPQVNVDVVELDEALLPIAQDYFGLQTSDRLHITFGDGRDFIESSPQKYDLIIIDVFSELAIPSKFLTLEFITHIYRHLHPSGVVAVNIIASYQGMNAGLIKSQMAAYQSLFEQVDIFPAAHGLTSWLSQNLVLVAQTAAGRDLRPFVRFAPIPPLAANIDDIQYD